VHTLDVAAFRRRFPLGSTERVALVDETGRYAGLVTTSAAYVSDSDLGARIDTLATETDYVLLPEQDVRSVMSMFDESEADYLAVVDEDRRVLGSVSERFVRRRYAEEIEKAQRDLFGERS
jgi:CIC family chloride channel protein